MGFQESAKATTHEPNIALAEAALGLLELQGCEKNSKR